MLLTPPWSTYICPGSACNMLDRLVGFRLNAPNVSHRMVAPWLSDTSICAFYSNRVNGRLDPLQGQTSSIPSLLQMFSIVIYLCTSRHQSISQRNPLKQSMILWTAIKSVFMVQAKSNFHGSRRLVTTYWLMQQTCLGVYKVIFPAKRNCYTLCILLVCWPREAWGYLLYFWAKPLIWNTCVPPQSPRTSKGDQRLIFSFLHAHYIVAVLAVLIGGVWSLLSYWMTTHAVA